MSLRCRRSLTAIALALSLLMWPRAEVRLEAWGVVGHRVVARLAWALLTPEARRQVTSLLDAVQEPGSSVSGQDAFVAGATWPDEVRPARPETYNWHFVDIPVTEARYEASRDCPPTDKGDCAIAELDRARAELIDAARPVSLRAESLKFMVHIVGDLHQPLHATDNHDRGGNDVKVAALRGEDGRATNLHAVWDTGLINLSTETEMARADRLWSLMQAARPVVGLDVVAWAEESHDIGVRLVYRYPSFVPTGPGPEAITLDVDYKVAAMATIDQQQQRAGARLAALINSLLK